MSLTDAGRANRASRESINQRHEQQPQQRNTAAATNKEATKEKENGERARQKEAHARREPRARSADMRKDNNSVPQTVQTPPRSQQTSATTKRTTRDTRTPVKATSSSGTDLTITKSASKNSLNNNKPAEPKKTAKPVDPEIAKTSNPTVTEPTVQIEQVETDIQVQQQSETGPEVEPVVEAQPVASTESVQVSTVVSEPETVLQQVVDVVSTTEEPMQGQPEATASGATTPSEGSVSGDSHTGAQSIGSSSTQLFRKIISSEEEAKAAMTEKRRLAREQMEREAEREQERLRQEELDQKMAEEELDRLALEARQAEEERLQKYYLRYNFYQSLIISILFVFRAIEETQRREEEERLRREDEIRQRAEKEQQERRAREESERARKENDERLRREEEERQERRKRVEAIVSYFSISVLKQTLIKYLVKTVFMLIDGSHTRQEWTRKSAEC